MTSLVFTMTGLAIIAVGILLWSNTKAGKKWLRKELDGHSEEQDEQLFDGSPFGEAKNLYAYRDLKNCLDRHICRALLKADMRGKSNKPSLC